MEKIVPHLWFDSEARTAAELYISTFPDSSLAGCTTLHDTPSGSCDILRVRLMGQPFQMINAGPLFKPNPSISFLVGCSTAEQVDTLSGRLSEGGFSLMPLGSYPFSERYAWVADKFGFSWQLMLKPDAPQTITPTLMFVGDQCGKAEQAVEFYMALFENSRLEHILRYQPEDHPDQPGTVKHAGFSLNGQRFAAMDSALDHKFGFNEAVSLMVHCKDQQELDVLWERLSADPKAEQCGWLKDRFGVSWQIVPERMDEMLSEGDPEALARVTRAFLDMKKFDLAALEKAYRGH